MAVLAGLVHEIQMTTMITGQHNSPQGWSATSHDRIHRLVLLIRELVLASIGWQILSQNISDFIPRFLFVSHPPSPLAIFPLLYCRVRPTEWLSGSGGTGETPQLLLRILANRACAERRSRCPTGAGVGRLFADS